MASQRRSPAPKPGKATPPPRSSAPSRPSAPKPRPSQPAPKPKQKPRRAAASLPSDASAAKPFRAFVRALMALVTLHRPRQLAPLGRALAAGIVALLAAVEEALAAPDKVRLAAIEKGAIVGLRIERAGEPAPLAPPAVVVPLGPVHHNLAGLALAMLEHLAHARKASGQAAFSVGLACDGDATHASVDDLAGDIAKIERSLLFLDEELCALGQQLTGMRKDQSALYHALALRRLLGGMSPEHERIFEQHALKTAAEAFTTT